MMKIFYVKSEYVDSRLDRWCRRNVQDVPLSFLDINLRKKLDKNLLLRIVNASIISYLSQKLYSSCLYE